MMTVSLKSVLSVCKRLVTRNFNFSPFSARQVSDGIIAMRFAVFAATLS